MDPAKVEVVVKWERLTTITEIRSFLGFAIYDCKFVKGFLMIASPFTRLTKKNVKFERDDDCEKNFNQLKQKFTTAQY